MKDLYKLEKVKQTVFWKIFVSNLSTTLSETRLYPFKTSTGQRIQLFLNSVS